MIMKVVTICPNDFLLFFSFPIAAINYISPPHKKQHKHNHRIKAKSKMSRPIERPNFNNNDTKHNLQEQKYPSFSQYNEKDFKYPTLQPPETQSTSPPLAPLNAYDGVSKYVQYPFATSFDLYKLQSFIEVDKSMPRKKSDPFPPNTTSITPTYSSTSSSSQSNKNEYPQPYTTSSYMDELVCPLHFRSAFCLHNY